RAYRVLELAQLLFDGHPVAVDLDAGLGDLGLAPAVGTEVPGEADEGGAEALRPEDGGRVVVDRPTAAELRQATPGERARGVLQALLLLEQRGERRIVRVRCPQRVRHLGQL